MNTKEISQNPVDDFTGRLFSFYSGVDGECEFEELVELAKQFIKTMYYNFDGLDPRHDSTGATPQDYADYYLHHKEL